MSVRLNIALGRAGESVIPTQGGLYCGQTAIVYKVVHRTKGVDVFFWEATNDVERFHFLRVLKGKTTKQVIQKFRKIYKCGPRR